MDLFPSPHFMFLLELLYDFLLMKIFQTAVVVRCWPKYGRIDLFWWEKIFQERNFWERFFFLDLRQKRHGPPCPKRLTLPRTGFDHKWNSAIAAIIFLKNHALKPPGIWLIGIQRYWDSTISLASVPRLQGGLPTKRGKKNHAVKKVQY